MICTISVSKRKVNIVRCCGDRRTIPLLDGQYNFAIRGREMYKGRYIQSDFSRRNIFKVSTSNKHRDRGYSCRIFRSTSQQSELRRCACTYINHKDLLSMKFKEAVRRARDRDVDVNAEPVPPPSRANKKGAIKKTLTKASTVRPATVTAVAAATATAITATTSAIDQMQW